MFKFQFVYFVSYLVIFVTTFCIFPCSSYTCIHDHVAAAKPPVSLTRSVKYREYVAERSRDPNFFEKLQVHTYFNSFGYTISSNVIGNVELVLNKIRSYVENLFEVRKRKRPFLLQREGCSQVWQTGPNRGKCSKYTDNSDLCSIKDIDFQIPERFLDKMEVYDESGTKPHYSIPSGPGLISSNFILFITIQEASFCEETDVSAYGSYCRLDPETNEPLAGIINLCPPYFSKKIYTEQHYYYVLLHELFHILGFSYNLFEKYLPCEKGIYCDFPRNVIQEDSDGIVRMMFPLVIKKMQEHFACSRSDFGAPMAYVKGNENETENIIATSHWHPVLMYSSIMSPSFSEYDTAFVDNITLAVFASTGWYRVHYEFAEIYRFGKDGGCGFGLNDSCANDSYLCDPKQNLTGCDLLHNTISQCNSLTPDYPCGVYKPSGLDACESETEKFFELNLYSLGFREKCFMVNDSNSQIKPTCFPVKCESRKHYDVLVNMSWWPCQNLGHEISLQNFTVLCPDAFLFCSQAVPSSVRNFCPPDTRFFVPVRMYFKQPQFNDLLAQKNFKKFKATVLRGIAEQMDIPVNFIVNATLSVFKQIYLDFAVCPPHSLDPIAFNNIILRIQKFLDSGNFIHVLKGHNDLSIVSNDIKIDPSDAISFSDHEGFRVLIIIPVICGIFIVTTLIASLLRQFLSHRHRPQREMVTQNEASIPMAEVRTS